MRLAAVLAGGPPRRPARDLNPVLAALADAVEAGVSPASWRQLAGLAVPLAAARASSPLLNAGIVQACIPPTDPLLRAALEEAVHRAGVALRACPGFPRPTATPAPPPPYRALRRRGALAWLGLTERDFLRSSAAPAMRRAAASALAAEGDRGALELLRRAVCVHQLLAERLAGPGAPWPGRPTSGREVRP